MAGVLPHYKMGPANYQAATLIYGGQWVMPHSLTPGTTDLTISLATGTGSPYCQSCLGVAGADANVIATQTGAANAYGQPIIDISVLGDYVAVYGGGYDIWCWYSAQVAPGGLLAISTNAGNAGTVVPWLGQASTFGQFAGDASAIVGKCTHPGGVASAMLTQQIGGQGSAAYFLGRARVYV